MAQTMNEKVGAEEKLIEDSRNTGQEENDYNKRLGPLSRNIIPHLINIYTCLATPQDLKIYHRDATFEDFFVRAFGIKEIKSIHYSFPKLVYDGKILEYSVEENETSPGCGKILFNVKQQYKVVYLGTEVNITTLMVLQIEKGKIIKHEDRINQHPVRGRNDISVPLVGRVREGIRRLTMLMLHVAMGFGKDPTPP